MNKTEQMAFDVSALKAQKSIVKCKRREIASPSTTSSAPKRAEALKIPLTQEDWLKEVRKRISAEKFRILPGDNQDPQIVLLGPKKNPTEILIGMDRNRRFSGITMAKEYDRPVENKIIEKCCTEVYEDDGNWYRYLEKPMKLTEVTKETASMVAKEITNLYKQSVSCGW